MIHVVHERIVGDQVDESRADGVLAEVVLLAVASAECLSSKGPTSSSASRLTHMQNPTPVGTSGRIRNDSVAISSPKVCTSYP
ncbi:MAG: hypothetical protein AB7J63_16255, partial [Vicinamibacterales bacterium]